MYAVFALVMQVAAAAPASEARSYDGAPACSRCIIELSTPTPLSDLSATSRIIRLSSGTIVLSDLWNSDRLQVFSSDGRRLRTLGRRGRGPGEYRNIVDLKLDQAERLHVFDYNGRWTILDSAGTVLATHRIPTGIFQGGVALLPGGGLVINMPDPTPERFGYWLFVTDSTGRVQAPMGVRFTEIPFSAAVSSVARRHVLPRADGTWVVHVVAYTIQRFDRTGRRLQEITRETDWFPEYDYADWPDRVRNRTEISTDEGPRPWISGASIDDAGRLWVAITLGLPGWSRERIDEGWVSDQFETVIEVWDLADAKVLASRKVPYYTIGFAESGELVTVVETPYRSDLTLWRVGLRDSNQGGGL